MLKRLRSRRLIGLAVCSLLFVAGCKGVPDGVLSEEQLARVMVDLNYAEALLNENLRDMVADDSACRVLMQSVLMRHGVTPEVYDSTLRWYGHNMVRYVEACVLADSMIADSLRKTDRMIAMEKSRRSSGADTMDVWMHTLTHQFSSNLPSDYITFSIERDTSWRKGDLFIWEMTPVNPQQPIMVKMAVDYADARSTTEVLEMPSSPSNETLTVTFQLDSNKVARRIYGYAYLPVRQGENSYINNVSLKHTRIDREEYYRGRRFVRPFYGAPHVSRRR